MLRAKCGTFVVVGFVQSDYRRCLGRYTYNIYVCWPPLLLVCYYAVFPLQVMSTWVRVCLQSCVVLLFFKKRWFQKCSWLTFRVFLTLLRLGSGSVGNILVNIGFKYIAVISKSIWVYFYDS